MSVKNETDRELMISGFTREHTRQLLLSSYPHHRIDGTMMSFADINQIIITYARFEMLEWEIGGKIANKYQFVNDSSSKIQTVSGEQHVVLLAKERFVISSSLYAKFYWEVTLLDFPAHSMDFVIGFTQHPDRAKLANQPRRFLGTAKNGEHSCFVSTFNNYVDVYGNGSRTKSLRFRSKLQIGDRLGIQFNFTANKAFVHYNGKVIGMMAERIPDRLFPAISLFSKDITVVCSQWKPIEYTKQSGEGAV